MTAPHSAAPLRRRERPVAWVPLGIAAGLAVSGMALLWLLAVFLRSDGATWRLLLPWLLFLLPVLGIGAAAGWLAGLGLRAVARALGRG